MTISLKAARGTILTSGAITLMGPTLVYQGSSNTYTITNYSSFSSWSVSSSVGTASITNDQITLTVPNPIGASQITLTVTKDSISEVFVIAGGASIVNKPSITSPTAGQTGVSLTPTIQSSEFATTPAGQGVHQSSDWQIAKDSSFLSLVVNVAASTTNKVSYTVAAGTLALNTVYYVRVRYTSSTIGTSAWSNTVTFTTANQYVKAPTVSVTGSPSDVSETPTISTSAFSVSGGSDTHYATDWQIVKTSDNSIVWQSNSNTTNKTSITVPAGILLENTGYKARARFIGTVLGESQWGELSFTTKTQFFVFGPSSAGLSYGGGYYAGANIVVGGQKYALIVAPKAQGGENYYKWKTSNTSTVGSTSVNDGLANTNAMIAAGATAHPAAQFCDALSINGYNDWYFPSRDELEICYRYLKPSTATNNTNFGANSNSDPIGYQYTSSYPSQVSAQIFHAAYSEGFSDMTMYWASTEYNSTNAWGEFFNDGGQSTSNSKATAYNIRAVRRVLIP